jgi:polysaccharide biosynthesis transport protein
VPVATNVSADAQGSVQLTHYWTILRRRWLVAAVTMISVIVTCLLYTVSEPPRYSTSVDVLIAPEAWGEVFAREGGASAPPAEDFQVYIDHAKSEACLGRLIQQGILGTPPAPRSAAWIDQFVTLENAITATRLKQHRVVTLAVDWGEPRFCQQLANALAQSYIETISEAKVRVGRMMEDFIDSEVVHVEEEIATLRTMLNELQREAMARDLSDSIRAQLNEIRAARDLLSERGAELAAAAAGLRDQKTESRAVGGGPDPAELFIAISRLLSSVPRDAAGPYVETLRLALESERDRLAEIIHRRQQSARVLTSRHPDQSAVTLDASRAAEALIDRALEWTRIAQSGLLDAEARILRPRATPLGSISILDADKPVADATEMDRYLHELRLREDLLERLVSRRLEIQLSRTGQEGSAAWIRPAPLPARPYAPNIWKGMPLWFAIGLIMAFAVVMVIEHIDTAIRFPDTLEMRLGIDVLGFVPRFEDLPTAEGAPPLAKKLMLRSDQNPPAAEAYRAIARKIEAADIRIVGITSPGPQEGKSTTSANLAMALAEVGKKTLLVSANLRRPTLHNFFGTPSAPGLSDIAADEIAPENCIVATSIEGLDLLPSGKPADSPAAVLSSRSVARAFAWMQSHYDIVLVDLPPAVLVADYLVLGRRVDAFVLVALIGRAREGDMRHVRDAINSVGGRILGAILNDASGEGKYNSGYTYGYHYQYAYTEAPEDAPK